MTPRAPDLLIVVQPPPATTVGESAGLTALLAAVPVLGSLGAVAFVVTSGSTFGPSRFLLAGLVVLGSLAFVVVAVWRTRSGRTTQRARARRVYLAHLADVRRRLRAAAREQRTASSGRHPDPAALPSLLASGSRGWQRSPGDPDWLQVRYACGTLSLQADVRAPEAEAADTPDLVCLSARHRLLAAHRRVDELPLCLRLATNGRVRVTGDLERRRSLVRAVVAQAAACHPPSRLTVAVLTEHSTVPTWDWVKWLPHTRVQRAADTGSGRCLVSTDLADLVALLEHRMGGASQAHLLLVLDHTRVPRDHPLLRSEGVTLLDLDLDPDLDPVRTDDRDVWLHIGPAIHDGGRPVVTARGAGLRDETGVADQLGVAAAEAVARRLTPRGAGGPRVADPLVTSADLPQLLGLGDRHQPVPGVEWPTRSSADHLRVPIGVAADGTAVVLDLKESAEQGMGPHGLVIGATGSGKSELLRTLVLGLALTHPPEVLNLVLVDFKGGATFAGMTAMPHVSAVITNLADELSLVERMQDALSGELTRRQESLRAGGNHASVRDYEKARTSGTQPELAPLPTLLVIVDEFSELLAVRPDLIDLFVAIGRLGRSLGIHLLLASQRLEEGRLRGLESHLSFRVALRTFSAGESRSVIGVPDAYELPPVPGSGFVRTEQSSLVRFKAAYVSGPAATRPAATRHPVPARRELFAFTTGGAPTLAPVEDAPPPPSALPGRSFFDLSMDAMAAHAPSAHPIWLPPLDEPETFDRLLPDLDVDPDLGLVSRDWRARGPLRFPWGTVDRPREQCRETLEIDLSGSAGHLGVVGGPRSGRSTALRGVVVGLALTHTPFELQVFTLDFGGGSLHALRELPHVSGMGTRSTPETVHRIVAEVREVVDARERYFREHGVEGIADYRSRRTAGVCDDGWGDVVLVVDGWGTLRSDFDELEPVLQTLAQRSLAFGVHLVTSASRWLDYRPGMRDVLGTRVELRLGDASDSEIDRRQAGLVPGERPGRGIAASRHHVLLALPRIDGDVRHESIGAGVQQLVGAVREAWRGPPAPQLRLLPTVVAIDEVRRSARPATPDVLLGLAERDLAAVGVNPRRDPHLLVFGDAGSGKSTLLRTYLDELTRLYPPEQAQVFVVDYRRSHLAEVEEGWLAGYVTNGDAAREMVAGLADVLRGRLPGPDVTPHQLRHRSWWTGADAFVVVDDLELVTASAGNPLDPLLPLLAHAGDVGLHVVVARRAGGAGRTYDPLLTALRDLAQPGVLLSGDSSEGPLLGQARAARAAPGRGRLVTRDGSRLMQAAWTPSVHDDA